MKTYLALAASLALWCGVLIYAGSAFADPVTPVVHNDLGMIVTAPAVAPVVPVIPALPANVDDTALIGIVNAIVGAFAQHNFLLVAGLILFLIVAGLRFIAPKIHGKAGAWLNTDRGGATLAVAVGVLLYLSSALVSGKVSWRVLPGGLVAAALGAGLRNLVRNVFMPKDKAPTVPAPAAPPATS